MSNKCRSKIYSLQVDYKVVFEAENIQIMCFFQIRISCPCKESKDLHCKSLAFFAYTRKNESEKKHD